MWQWTLCWLLWEFSCSAQFKLSEVLKNRFWRVQICRQSFKDTEYLHFSLGTSYIFITFQYRIFIPMNTAFCIFWFNLARSCIKILWSNPHLNILFHCVLRHSILWAVVFNYLKKYCEIILKKTKEKLILQSPIKVILCWELALWDYWTAWNRFSFSPCFEYLFFLRWTSNTVKLILLHLLVTHRI